MIELDYRRYGLLRSKLVYFAEHLPSVDGYHFVSCRHCYKQLPCHYPYEHVQRYTTLFDLAQDSEKLFSQIHRKRRLIIKKGLKIGFQFSFQRPTLEGLKEFRQLYNKFIAPKGAGPLINFGILLDLMPFMTVVTGKFGDQTLMMLLIISDGRTAAIHLGGRNEASSYPQEMYYLGSVMHWEVILYFKNCGLQVFDFGGIALGPDSPTAGITQHKLSFGGEVVPTHYYEAAVSNLARAFLAGAETGYSLIRRFFNR
jgi:lipid II:glycine glycyltransferase (peptidoglycan interpeptide bridge formation enzyme)